MKCFILCFILILSFRVCFPQAPGIQWQNTIGGSGMDEPFSIVSTTDGGYLVGGYSVSGISGDKTEAGEFYGDFWVLKLDSTGNIVWQNTIGGDEEDILYSAAQTDDGGYILGGSSMSGISGDKHEACRGNKDYWIVKISAIGEVEWEKTIGGFGIDVLRSIIQTSDGGFLAGGYSTSGISGDKTEVNLGSYDYWIVKLNSTGGIEWQNTIGGSSFDYLYSIIQCTDGGYFLAGSSQSNISLDKNQSCKGAKDYWVLKLNSFGMIQWQKTIGGNLDDDLFAVVQTMDNGFLLAGSSQSGISGDKTESSFGMADFWPIKLDSIGNILWQKTIGGSNADYLKSVSENEAGQYVLSGYTYSLVSGNITDPSSGFGDYLIVKLASPGSISWQTTIGGTEEEFLTTSAISLDGGYVLAGKSKSNISGVKTELSNGFFDYWVVKLNSDCNIEICNGIDDDCDGLVDDSTEPEIIISTTDPVSFCSGSTATLTATHTGETLQWYRNGIAIPGAIALNYTTNKAGEYICKATNPCGITTSNSITIVVYPKPSANIIALGPTTFCEGGSVTLSASIAPGTSYQWYKGATILAGMTLNTYVATSSGNYKCKITKTATGCYKNSNTISVSVPCRTGENNETVEIIVTPNPANEYINITSNNPLGVMLIIDAYGRILQSFSCESSFFQLPIESLATGIYWIYSNGEKACFIKQ